MMRKLVLTPMSATHLNMLRQINHKAQVLQRILINRPHRVIQEIRANKQNKRKNPRIMLCCLVKGSNAFGVHHYHTAGATISRGTHDGPTPYSYTLSAGVYSMPNVKSLVFVQNDFVEKVTFSRAVFASDPHDGDGRRNRFQEIQGVWVQREPLFLGISDEGNWFFGIGGPGRGWAKLRLGRLFQTLGTINQGATILHFLNF